MLREFLIPLCAAAIAIGAAPCAASDRAVLERTLGQISAAPPAPIILPDGRPLHAGERSKELPLLRTALAAYGFAPALGPRDDASLYDPAMVDAIKRFQSEVGLRDDGVVGNDTRLALRVFDGDRAAMIEQSLGQPDPPAKGRYVLVNLAAGLAVAMEDGHPVITSKVIIGKPPLETPLLQARIQSVTINPYWVVPDGIVEREFGGNPHTERPGPKNPLGKIRLDMPNRYDVFIHDTIAPRLFARDRRTFSHGCLRAEKIHELAFWLLGSQKWQSEQVDSLLASWHSHTIMLDKLVPVYVQYRTATVASTGMVIYHPDPYHLLPQPAGAAPPVQAVPSTQAPPGTGSLPSRVSVSTASMSNQGPAESIVSQAAASAPTPKTSAESGALVAAPAFPSHHP